MNNTIKRTWNQGSMVNIEDLRGMTFQAESGGHTFVISAIDADGNAVSLSGTPAGTMLRPDNTDQALTCSISGGKVYATLPAGCYDVPGRAGITIFLTSNSQKAAIYAAVVSVIRTQSGTAAPGTTQSVVDLINAINAAIAGIPATDTALKAAMAPTYSNTGLYVVGSYAWYNGVLKRCIVPITTAESYTAAHWTDAALGNDLRDLKSALKQSTGNKLIDWVDGYYVATNGSSFNEANRVAQGTGSWRYAIIEASEGDEFTISAKGAGTPRAWAFANSSKAIISVAPASTNIENVHLIAPENTAYLVLNDQLKTKDSFYGWLLKQKESDQITGQDEAESLDYKLIKEGYIVRKFASAELKTGAIIPSNGFFDAVATAYISTPFLRIPAGCGGMITNMKVAANAYGGFAYYDINYNYISGGNNDTTGDADGIYSLFYKENIPANAKYIRICNNTGLHESTNDLFVIYTSDVAFQCAHELDGNIQSVIQSEDKNGVVTIKPYFLNGCTRFNNFKIYDLSVHYARTGYIKIPEKCKRIETNMYCSNTDFGICFLDENKDIISGVSLHNSNSIHDITTIPSGTVYIIASTSHLDPTDFSALDSKYIKFFQYDNTDRNKENDAYNASASIGANHEKLIFDFWKNKVLDSSSQVIDMNGYSITDEILVEDFASVTIENTVSGTDRYVVYDKDHNIVSYGGASELTTTVTLPYGSKYLLVALSFAQEATFAVYGNGKYYGKKVSIVGDSISSYDGYNPEGYAYYYPHGEVDDVSKTWWMRVINKTGMTLLRNCSWSASKVTGDSTGTAEAGCSTQRVSDLSDGTNNPDVIFVYIGTNDWNHSYEIGDFDSTSDIPQEGTISVISDAYALLLYKIRTTYPNAELFCLTDLEGRTQPGDVQYPVLNSRGESIHQMNHEIIELAHIFGAKVVDLEACGIHFWNVPQYTVDGSSQYPINTNIHPNIAGMTLICDAVLKTMMY